MPRYFTLIEFDGETWSPQFGDYQRSVVNDERRDRHHGFPYLPLNHMRVIQTEDDSQESINRLVAEINEAERAKRNQVRVES